MEQQDSGAVPSIVTVAHMMPGQWTVNENESQNAFMTCGHLWWLMIW